MKDIKLQIQEALRYPKQDISNQQTYMPSHIKVKELEGSQRGNKILHTHLRTKIRITADLVRNYGSQKTMTFCSLLQSSKNKTKNKNLSTKNSIARKVFFIMNAT